MAKAHKLPSGNWRVQAKRNGEVKSFTSSDKKTAEYLAIKWQNENSAETVSKITVGSALEQYIESKANVLSPSTVCGYISMKENAFGELYNIRINDLTMQQVQVAVNRLSIDHSPKYVRNVHGLLSATLRMFRPDFTLTTTLPKGDKKEMFIPDDDDIKKLMRAISGTRMEIPVLLAAFGPMRRGEICALTSDDINGNIITVNKALARTPNNEWVLKPPKTYSSNREIEYPDFIIKKMSGINGRITDLTPSAITDAFPKILTKLGMPHFRFHDLRHYTASILHAIGIPDKYIMSRGGWSSTYTLNRVYKHALKTQKDIQTEKIIQYFSNMN